MHKLQFTKFFDVKSPIIEYIENGYNNAGIDIYMPRPTKEFYDALLKANEKIVSEKQSVLVTFDDTKEVSSFGIYKGKGTCYPLMTYKDGNYDIYGKIQIPIGISILIPKDHYIDLRSKSSNFKNEFSSVTGLIDCNYTFSWSVQMHFLKSDEDWGKIVQIKVDEKLAQFILKKSEPIIELGEIPLLEWEKLDDVLARREKRIGGYGSTGKF